MVISPVRSPSSILGISTVIDVLVEVGSYLIGEKIGA
jgi:hypothetical protein